ncbi:hypothetical protein B0T22DRAFT_151824 [Podospora appendiculata]|uniref:SAP domain-containing protein n=1 Tax=Podospora appendiculata TaxID=314037 RepID=A0AAE1CCD2_9PEZI|nr:hypothetical protein B0T22DRAFT_151824 [Podospora appendiculata]
MTTDWSRLTVIDLRQELKRRGLPQAGKKADLVDRLTTADAKDEQAEAEAEAVEAEAEVEAGPGPGPRPDAKSEGEGKPTTNDDGTVSGAKIGTATENGHEPAQTAPASTEPQLDATPASQPYKPFEPKNETSPPHSTSPSLPILPQEPVPEVLAVDSSSGNAEAAGSAAEPSAPTAVSPLDRESAGTEKLDEPVAAAPSIDPVPSVPELTGDARSRKRRSRSPPPSGDESSRKRTRPSDQYDEHDDTARNWRSTPEKGNVSQPLDELLPLDDNPAAQDASYAKLQPEYPERRRSQSRDDTDTQMTDVEENNFQARHESPPYAEDRGQDSHDAPAYDRRQDAYGDQMDHDSRDVAPAEHPATSALYIKNFMRPIKDQVLREYLVDLATPPGSVPDPDSVVDFYLDQIRTHAFVRFTSISSASRVRIALHGKVWPNERERKELWVDFIPPENISDWIEREQSEGGRGSATRTRWEVRYEPDDEGRIAARLVNAEAEPARQPSRAPLPPPPSAPAMSIPSGPARQYPGIEAAPLGPRGRGGNRADNGGIWQSTDTRPSLPFKPVPEELAQRRLEHMRSYYTQDRHRDMGRADEINRYTFEDSDSFVDRGREVFVGIRPPHRERGGGRPFRGEPFRGDSFRGDRGPPRGPPPPFLPRGGDRYISGREEPRSDVPRSRLDGAPLPTFGGGGGGGFGGGGFRSERRGGGGGGGGGRRGDYRGYR